MQKNTQFKISQHWSLIGFTVPVVVIGLGLVLPGSCIAGFSEPTLGFAATVLGAGVAFLVGRKTPGAVGSRHV